MNQFFITDDSGIRRIVRYVAEGNLKDPDTVFFGFAGQAELPNELNPNDDRNGYWYTHAGSLYRSAVDALFERIWNR